jgi:hypothetical protein
MNRHSVPNATLGLPGNPINGGSKPRFYDFNDGVTRLVKWSPSTRAFCAICAYAAKAATTTIPKPYSVAGSPMA